METGNVVDTELSLACLECSIKLTVLTVDAYRLVGCPSCIAIANRAVHCVLLYLLDTTTTEQVCG